MAAHGFTYYSVGREPASPEDATRRRRQLPRGTSSHHEQTARSGHRRCRISRLPLCDALLAEGYSVVVRGQPAHRSVCPTSSILQNESRFEFPADRYLPALRLRQSGLRLPLRLSRQPRGLHEHGIETLQVGSLGTFHALEMARKYGAKFLISSTSECYGDPLEHPQKETYWGNVNPIGPRSVYDEAKRFTEAVTMAYHRYHKVDTRIVRIFNTYGPRMQLNDGRVIPNFMKQALRGEDMTVYGDGARPAASAMSATKSMASCALAQSDEHLPANIGNPTEFTMLECAQTRADGDRIEKQDSLTNRCRRTIPSSAGPTSPRPAPAGMGTKNRSGDRAEAVAGIFPQSGIRGEVKPRLSLSAV